MIQPEEKYQKLLLVSSFLLLFIGRWFISGTGYLDDPDEYPFYYVLKHFQDIIRFDIQRWTDTVFRVYGSFPDITIRSLQIPFLLAYSALISKPLEHPESLVAVGFFNIIISLGVLFIFYKILIRLGTSFHLALLGVILMGTLVNTNIYTRHILPYESSLLLHCIGFYIILNDKVNRRRVLISGFITALAFTLYPGYFMFIFISGGWILSFHSKSFKKAVASAVTFIAPFAGLFSIYEGICQLTDRSYLTFIADYSLSAIAGSFNEGLTFIFINFFLAENWWGLALISLCIIALVLAIFNRAADKLKYFLLIGALAYVLYGSYIYVFEKMVFYSRVLLMYYLFVVAGVVYLVKIQKFLNSHYLMALISMAAFINYFFVVKDLKSLGYPRSEIYLQELSPSDDIYFIYKSELECAIDYSDREKWFLSNVDTSRLSNGGYILKNFCFFNHFPDTFIDSYSPHDPNDDQLIFFSKPHFMSHSIYALNYCTKKGRDFFLKRKLELQVLKE